MDASQLTRIRRAVAVATGPRPLFGFTESVDYTDAKFGTREVVFQGAIVKPCCTEEEGLPLALSLTFEDEPTRSISRGSSKLAQFIASRPQSTYTNFRDIVAAYKSFVPDGEGTTRTVNGGFDLYGSGRIVFADGSSVSFSGEYSSDVMPPGDVRIYGIIVAIFMGGTSLTAVTFVPSTLSNVLEVFLLGGSSVTSLNLSGMSTMFACLIGGNPYLTSVDFTPCTSIENIGVEENTSLDSISITNLSALTELTAYDNSLNSLDISGDVSLNSINCRGNLLTQLTADNIAADLVTYGLTSGLYYVNPQSNGAINVTGGDYDTLSTRGWDIG